MPKEIRLPRKLQKQVMDIAIASPGVETCGLLGGNKNELRSFYPVNNIAPDPGSAFLMEPQEQIHAMRQMREKGESLRGIYHSHPDSGAAPSVTDRTRANYPGVYYLIVSLQTSPPDLQAYYFDGKKFTTSVIDII